MATRSECSAKFSSLALRIKLQRRDPTHAIDHRKNPYCVPFFLKGHGSTGLPDIVKSPLHCQFLFQIKISWIKTMYIRVPPKIDSKACLFHKCKPTTLSPAMMAGNTSFKLV